MDERILRFPDLQGGIEGDGISQPAGTVEFAQSIHPRRWASAIAGRRERTGDGTPHGKEGGGGVQGKEDIVHDNKILESLGLGDGPWTVGMGPIICICRCDGKNIGGGE